MNLLKSFFIILLIIIIEISAIAQEFPDQQFVIRGIDELSLYEETSQNLLYNSTTNSIELTPESKNGFYISKPLSFEQKFNRGLPSWNGFAPEGQHSAFRVSMRYKMSYGWSDWVTVGFWDKNLWSYYGKTSFDGGKISVDYAKIDYYITEYQYKIELKRLSLDYDSPSIKQLSFFVSDSRTTDFVNINQLTNDNPPAIFIPTNFVYQYSVDPVIGPRICSPSTLSMIIQSYDSDIDTYDFAVRTRDPYWDLFGVWPRGVQHASEYGLIGSVTRYRTWTDAYNVLKNGGRIAMTVGPPLFSAHLLMLAGFDENGNPIIHNPGSSNGYGTTYNKKKITESWFNKGGISYTFYQENISNSNEIEKSEDNYLTVYPNPITNIINLEFDVKNEQKVEVIISNMLGEMVYNKSFSYPNGHIQVIVNEDIPPGVYFLNLFTENEKISKLLIKK